MRTDTRPDTDREAKLAAVHDRLAAAVEALVTGDDWRRALEFAARFRSRSFANTVLIQVQHAEAYAQGRVPDPVPTFVAGYRQWQSIGRQVRRGAQGYAILAPVTARYAAADPTAPPGTWRPLDPREQTQPGEVTRTRLVGTRVAHVWDLSSTDGDPLPKRPVPQLLRGQAPAGLRDGLVRQIQERGFVLRTVPDADALGGANGLTDYRARTVSVRDDVDDASQCRTLGHELAHVLLHGPDHPDASRHRGVAEVEAEAVALMLFAAHAMDSSAYTVPYVASWATTVPGTEPAQVVAATADRARATALAILDHLDTTQVPGGDPPGLTRTGHDAPAVAGGTAPVPGPAPSLASGLAVGGHDLDDDTHPPSVSGPTEAWAL